MEESWLIILPIRASRLFDSVYELGKNDFTPLVNCTSAQNSANQEAVNKLQNRIDMLNVISSKCQQIDASSFSGIEVETAIQYYNTNAVEIIYYRCDPSIRDVANKYNDYLGVLNSVNPIIIAASNRIFRNADAAISALQSHIDALRLARSAFDTDPNGGGGLSSIENEIADCRSAFQTLKRYYFGHWYDQHDQKAQQYYGKFTSLEFDVNQMALIDELDRLRDEYVTAPKGPRLVPPRSSFTQSKGSAHFSFGELNTGDFSWAIVSDRLLTALEGIRSDLGNKALILTSGYRSPKANDSEPDSVQNSRHQYGDAVDLTPTDLNSDGNIDKSDQDLLVTAAKKFFAPTNVIAKPMITVHMEYD
jgi:hypothetical protein